VEERGDELCAVVASDDCGGEHGEYGVGDGGVGVGAAAGADPQEPGVPGEAWTLR